MAAEDVNGEAEVFDYVIVGAGTAGCVLAHRLTENDCSATVCILEAGPSDRHPFLHIPAGFIKVVFDPRYTWRFQTDPGGAINGRSISVPQGRTVGGSSSVNGMIFNRGQRNDYDGWARAGNEGWGYLDVLPYFRKLERRIGEADAHYRGMEGPLPVTSTDWIHPLSEAFMAGAEHAGIPRNPDFNGRSQAGVGYMQRSIYRGRRQSAADVYLKPALRTKRVKLRTGATVLRLDFEGERAVGARYLQDGRGEPMQVKARREVLLCAGAVNSPRILQLSGIGPAPLLQQLGIPVRQALPAGEGLRDHFSVRVVAGVRNCLTLNEIARGPRLFAQVARWLLGYPSVLALSPALVHWFWKSDPALDAPDLQGIFTPGSYKEGFMGLLDDFPGMSAGVNQHRPRSVGHVHARSVDPFVDPVIQPNYLSHSHDQQVLVAGIKMARELLRTPALAKFFDEERMPGPAAQSDDDVLAFARARGTTSYHLVGTCRMGPAHDRTTVVDSTLRVHGCEGLRVADASVMPDIPSANTCAATLMLAEKAADLIGQRKPLPRVEGVH